MAETKTNRPETSRQTTSSQRDPQQGSLQRRQQTAWPSNPFEMMDRLTEEMFGRMFGDYVGPRRSWLARSPFRSLRGQAPQGQEQGLWAPRVEAFQQGDRFIIRAELPGLKKDDVQVEVTDDHVTVQGERRDRQEENREGYYHSEVEYGQFYRQIALPEGVIADNAQATFKDGVLEVAMPAPPSEANRGRRLEIKEGSTEANERK